MGKFIHGLNADLQTEIRVLNPYNMDQAMELAMKPEERNRVNGTKRAGLCSGSFSIYNRGPMSDSSFLLWVKRGGSIVNSKSWATNSNASQPSVNNVKPISPSNRELGEMRRLTEKEF